MLFYMASDRRTASSLIGVTQCIHYDSRYRTSAFVVQAPAHHALYNVLMAIDGTIHSPMHPSSVIQLPAYNVRLATYYFSQHSYEDAGGEDGFSLPPVGRGWESISKASAR